MNLATTSKQLTLIVFTTIVLLLIPFIGMHTTDAVQWTRFDFIVAGALIFFTGYGIAIVQAQPVTTRRKIWMAIAIITAAIYVWAELAVGIFTNIGS